MAIFYCFHCSQCGRQAVNDDKTKWYVHLSERRGTKSDHRVPGITVTKTDERQSAA